MYVSLNRIFQIFYLLLTALGMAQSSVIAHAAPPDVASVQMLREIYSELASLNTATEGEPQFSVEEEIQYFENNVKDPDSARAFIQGLYSLSHPSPDFDHKAKLHPLLEEVRRLSFTIFEFDAGFKDGLVNKRARAEGFKLPSLFNISAAAAGIFVIETFRLYFYAVQQCLSLCNNAVQSMSESELMSRSGVFPGRSFICDSYMNDGDSSRYSLSPRFNYRAIDENMEGLSCSQVQFQLLVHTAALGTLVALVPPTVYLGQKAYGAVCGATQFIKSYFKKSNPQLLNDPLLKDVFNQVEEELGIRQMDQIIAKVVGMRVVMWPCSNEFEHCPICLEDFVGFESTVATECCSTKFDQVCLQGWFKSLESENQAPACPYCRGAMDNLQ
jgi:hypothetical protein